MHTHVLHAGWANMLACHFMILLRKLFSLFS
jgi:hypothetical protein